MASAVTKPVAQRSFIVSPFACTMRVLIVDDDSSVRNLMSIMLARLGHECIVAENGLEAVKCFSSDRQRIDLVITDLNMPLMDGYETVCQIRKIDPDARIISMSANCAAEPPCDTPFLEKPFTFKTLRLCLALARGERLRKAG